MRTTLTLDDDVAEALKERSRVTGESFKVVLNSAVRAGLSRGAEQVGSESPFRVDAKACGFRSGIDPLKLNQVYDDLEIDDMVYEAGSTTPPPAVHEP